MLYNDSAFWEDPGLGLAAKPPKPPPSSPPPLKDHLNHDALHANHLGRVQRQRRGEQRHVAEDWAEPVKAANTMARDDNRCAFFLVLAD